MSLGYIDSAVLTDIADAIRDTFGTTKTYKPTQMANAIRTQGKLPLYSFSDATDEQLTEMVNAYYNGIITLDDVKSVWSVGDKRAISLSAMEATGVGESHVAQEQYFTILDFEHDNLSTSINDKTKALITVQQLNLLSNGTTLEGGYMESTNTNANGWSGSARYKWCNEVFKAALPSYIQNMIRPVKKLTSAGNKSTTINTSTDSIFLLSEIEIFGSIPSSVSGEGTQYSYYTTAANRIKYIGNTSTQGSARGLWERSPFSSSADGFCFVGSNGTAGGADASIALGLAPAFCI
jgi:hypothetical protein